MPIFDGWLWLLMIGDDGDEEEDDDIVVDGRLIVIDDDWWWLMMMGDDEACCWWLFMMIDDFDSDWLWLMMFDYCWLRFIFEKSRLEITPQLANVNTIFCSFSRFSLENTAKISKMNKKWTYFSLEKCDHSVFFLLMGVVNWPTIDWPLITAN